MEHIAKEYPKLWSVVEVIAESSIFQKKAVLNFLKGADSSYFEFAEDLIERLGGITDSDSAHQYLAKTYLWYTKTIKIEEMYFAKKGEYRFSDYEEVYQRVYGRDDYMRDYVFGLGMTQIFWENHWEIFSFFRKDFIPLVLDGKTAAEIGVGHGIFHSELLKSCTGMNSTLIDISPVSLNVTKRLLEVTGIQGDRIKEMNCDIQKKNPLKDLSLDALLIGELIEHIQDAGPVMEKLASKMKQSGYCYFSTAANSPAEDHIILFEKVDDIRTFVENAGWRIIKEHIGTLKNMTIEESENKKHNINYAAVLQAAK